MHIQVDRVAPNGRKKNPSWWQKTTNCWIRLQLIEVIFTTHMHLLILHLFGTSFHAVFPLCRPLKVYYFTDTLHFQFLNWNITLKFVKGQIISLSIMASASATFLCFGMSTQLPVRINNQVKIMLLVIYF